MTKKLISSTITFSILLALLTFSVNSFAVQSIDGQIHTPDTTPDASPIAVVIHINEDNSGNVFFKPSEFTIKQGEEVLILNNSTGDHSFTNGESADDQMAGKIFDTKMIKPGSFSEYLAFNLSPGDYPFYSSTDPVKIKGKMTVLPQ